jgi:hypothetical protein
VKYLLTCEVEANFFLSTGCDGNHLPEEDLALFDTEEELVESLVKRLNFPASDFRAPYFNKTFTAEELWKPPKDCWVRKHVVKTLLETLEDVYNLFGDIQIVTPFDWYEVEDAYVLTGRHYTDAGLYDPLTEINI